MILPSIDLMDGKAVQLRQGQHKVLEREDPKTLAKEFGFFGEIAVVDIDAALGKGNNRKLIRELCQIAPCRVGGGIRSEEDVVGLIKSGARKVVIGTRAEPEFLSKFPKDWLIVALDCREGKIVNQGWTKSTDQTPEELAPKLEPYCSEFLITLVDTEGMLGGIPLEPIQALKNVTKNPITAAGGISSISDIKTLAEIEVNAQIGMALYTGKIQLDQAILEILDFSKGPIPTIVQDQAGQVRMLAYSNPESLSKVFQAKQGWYYSRSRNTLWRKGETSGNTQKVLEVRFDCDRDTLLFKVKQKGPTCHQGAYSCFGGPEGNVLQELFQVIASRIQNPKPGSYTNTLISDSNLLKKKLLEEMQEMLNYKDRENLIWEAADLLYFISVLLGKEQISLQEVLDELRGRRR